MKKYSKIILIIGVILTTCIWIGCSNQSNKKEKESVLVLKGLYSFGPEVKSFVDCAEGREFWVADSAKTLEQEYVRLGFEKPYTPVYIEVECFIKKSDTTKGISGGYDSTMVVTKLLKLNKDIPEGICNQ